MKTFFAILLGLVLFQNCHADEWFSPMSGEEIAWEGAYVFVTMIDWGQTKNFRSKGVKERNPILGKEPSQERVDTLIGLAIISHVLIAYALPEKYRELWSFSFLILETEAVLGNYDKGYSPKFDIKFQAKF